MKKLIILTISIFSVGALFAAGCQDMRAAETERNYSINMAEPTDDNSPNGVNKPEYKLIRPEPNSLPRHMPHKRRG